MALCVKQATAHKGITATAPKGLPINPPKASFPQGPKVPVQLDPTGQAGGAPTSQSNLTTSRSADNKTPVKPEPAAVKSGLRFF